MTARMMEHEEATKNLVAERYLLGELTENDREAYEEHLFSCPVCFEQIKAGTEFVGHLRMMGAEKPVAAETVAAKPGFFATLRQPLTAMAFTLLMVVSGVSVHQYRVISVLRQAQVAPGFFLSDGAKATTKTVTVPTNSPFGVQFQVLEPGDFKSYEAQLVSGSKSAGSPFQFSAEQIKETTIQILLHSDNLRAGTYSIVVNGISPDGHRTELTRYSFQLQLQE
jgi:methionine-rich copper-binding protein CopC